VLLKMVVAGAFAVLVMAMMLRTRRAHRRADSVARYARAVSALRTIADEPRPAVHMDASIEGAPKLQVISDVTSLEGVRARRSGRASRAAARLDPELVARRPLIAQLPSVSAPKRGESGQQAG
jgi:hypothetical protein